MVSPTYGNCISNSCLTYSAANCLHAYHAKQLSNCNLIVSAAFAPVVLDIEVKMDEKASRKDCSNQTVMKVDIDYTTNAGCAKVRAV